MKTIALLCWYDEPASWLAELVASLGRCGVDHLVAADGAYFLYPGGRPRSAADQHDAIVRTAAGCGMGLTLHFPQEPWPGNEVEKRSMLFALGERVAEPDTDWYLAVDGDMVVTNGADLRRALEDTEEDCALLSLWEFDPVLGEEVECLVPLLYRAVLGLRAVDNHYTYRTPDGRFLRGHVDEVAVEPAAMLPQIRVEHRRCLRPPVRQNARSEYMALSDAVGGERVYAA